MKLWPPYLSPRPQITPLVTTTAPDSDPIAIRQAERRDLLDILRIEQASFPQPWPYNAFVRFLDEPGFLVAITPTDSSVAGYIVANSVQHHNQSIGHVKDLAVHPGYRRRGIAKRLLERALAILTANGVTRTKLEVRRSNTAARALYRQCGFERHREVPGYYDDGEDALILVADLVDR